MKDEHDNRTIDFINKFERQGNSAASQASS